jgi:hypothetical protein
VAAAQEQPQGELTERSRKMQAMQLLLRMNDAFSPAVAAPVAASAAALPPAAAAAAAAAAADAAAAAAAAGSASSAGSGSAGSVAPPAAGLAAAARLEQLLREHCPEKLGNLPLLLQKYTGKEAAVIAKIEQRYGARAWRGAAGTPTATAAPEGLQPKPAAAQVALASCAPPPPSPSPSPLPPPSSQGSPPPPRWEATTPVDTPPLDSPGHARTDSPGAGAGAGAGAAARLEQLLREHCPEKVHIRPSEPTLCAAACMQCTTH